MRRVALVTFIAAGLAVVPSTASAQLLQLGRDSTYKVGPLKCVKNRTTPNYPYGAAATTGCTITNGPERTIFCGTEQDNRYRESHGFTGCRVDVAAYHVKCGVSTDSYDYYFVDYRDRYGCTASVGAATTGVYCDDHQYQPPYPTPDYGEFVTCVAGPISVRCGDIGSVPGGCRIAIGALFSCDVAVADPAGSLASCAGAQRRT
jgi:hypothetical protein